MRYFIGLDIGGTKIEGILVNDKYKIIKKNIKKTEADKPREITLKNIFSVIKELKQNYKLSGIGISTAGYVKNKVLVNCPNIPNLNNINIIKDFKKNIKEKFIVENDANCFALAENIYWKKKNLVGVILGTGIGTGIIINGKLYRGKSGSTEFGHTIIASSGLKCRCGKKGDFESWCSGNSILKRYKKLGGKLKKTQEIFKSKDKLAKKIIDETYKYLGIGLANIITALNPDLIVLGGGVSNGIDYNRINKEVKKNVIKELRDDVKIVKNKLGADSGVIGAVELIKLNLYK